MENSITKFLENGNILMRGLFSNGDGLWEDEDGSAY